jgi:signal transduction histidine kinase
MASNRSRENDMILKDHACAIKHKNILANNDLPEKIKYLEELNASKDKVLSIIMHDLRGPINSLKSILAIPDIEFTNQEREIYREELLQQLRALGETMDGLFIWASRSFKDEMAEHAQQAKLKDVTARVVSSMEARLQEKQITLSTIYSSNNTISACSYEIEIIIRNILQNAIKFTPHGGLINIHLEEIDRWLSVAITDSGVGISPKQMEHIFTTKTKSTPGTEGEKGKGLGLILCKYLTERNDGILEISSAIHSGTSISIKFPVSNI